MTIQRIQRRGIRYNVEDVLRYKHKNRKPGAPLVVDIARVLVWHGGGPEIVCAVVEVARPDCLTPGLACDAAWAKATEDAIRECEGYVREVAGP